MIRPLLAILLIASCAGLRALDCEARGGQAYRWNPAWPNCIDFAGAVLCGRKASTYFSFAGCSL